MSNYSLGGCKDEGRGGNPSGLISLQSLSAVISRAQLEEEECHMGFMLKDYKHCPQPSKKCLLSRVPRRQIFMGSFVQSFGTLVTFLHSSAQWASCKKSASGI